MKFSKALFTIICVLAFSLNLNAQSTQDNPIESISAAEIRDHIFFLASDYLNGRVAATPEYEIAAQYVSAQFAAAGLQPAIEKEDGTKCYFQGVPFNRTTYNDDILWKVSKEGDVKTLVHKKDFKVMYGNNLNHEHMELVWAGYGLEDKKSKWNDFKGLDIEGKMLVCISGAPVKNGKPILSEEEHEKYTGENGMRSKMMTLFRRGAAGVIIIDMGNTGGSGYDQTSSAFQTEKVSYRSDQNRPSRRRSFPSFYIGNPDILNVLMAGNENNPLNNPDDILENYKPQELKDTYLDGSVEIVKEDVINSNNVVGIVPGTDPILKDEYIVVGAHLDHIAPQGGQVCNGADDNASGSSGVMEIAEAIAMNPCKRSVVFITYTAEEKGLLGSKFFVSSDAFPIEQIKFNINMDMIGRSSPKNEDTRAHYVVTNKRYEKELNAFINGVNEGVTDFPLIIDNDKNSPGGSDHQSFIGEGIPAFFFFSGVHPDLHKPTDDADKIDYPKAESISKLGYLLADKLANMDEVPDFLEK